MPRRPSTAASRGLDRSLILGAVVGSVVLMAARQAFAEEAAPGLDLARAFTGLDPGNAGLAVRTFALITVLSVVPSIVLLTTCYPRILIVLSFLRRALGAQDLPSSQILAGLTLILSAGVMFPVWKRVHDEAYAPFQRGELKSAEEALVKAAGPVKEFMLAHTFEKDLRLFVEMSESRRTSRDEGSPGAGPAASPGESAETVEDLSFFVVLPAFVLSELKLAFQMGFLLYLPFLIIDLAVSAVLISMGMFMLPPVLVSLPLKVLVFVLADGWNLLVGQLLEGFQVLN